MSLGDADHAGLGGQLREPMTHARFLEMFPDDAACAAYLKRRFYADGTSCPGCKRPSKFHPIRGRSAYSCQFCGVHVYPTSGTIFHKSRTSLQLWFWAICLVASTRGHISTRELERELRVTYKTAQRMLTQIRSRLDLEPTPEPEAPSPEVPAPEPASPRAWHRARRRG